jgi:hypothetical protein
MRGSSRICPAFSILAMSTCSSWLMQITSSQSANGSVGCRNPRKAVSNDDVSGSCPSGLHRQCGLSEHPQTYVRARYCPEYLGGA